MKLSSVCLTSEFQKLRCVRDEFLLRGQGRFLFLPDNITASRKYIIRQQVEARVRASAAFAGKPV